MDRTVRDVLEPFAPRTTALLSTRRRDGRAYFRTWSTSRKARRMRRDPEIALAPSTFRGRPTGRRISARVRRLDGDEARRAGELLGRRYRILHGLLVPALHRLRGLRTEHYEALPTGLR